MSGWANNSLCPPTDLVLPMPIKEHEVDKISRSISVVESVVPESIQVFFSSRIFPPAIYLA